jgi:outer membrane protein assembly factor BamE (lipoprotein component of BamABCDE complex)
MSTAAVARGVGKTIKWFVIACFSLIVILIAVAIVGLGVAANDSDKQATNVAAHISEIHMGMTRPEVRAILGKPDSTQHLESGGLVSDMWYYGTLSTKGSYQFAFDNGVLTSKNRW